MPPSLAFAIIYLYIDLTYISSYLSMLRHGSSQLQSQNGGGVSGVVSVDRTFPGHLAEGVAGSVPKRQLRISIEPILSRAMALEAGRSHRRTDLNARGIGFVSSRPFRPRPSAMGNVREDDMGSGDDRQGGSRP
jgi:hypothetical protein